MAKRREHVEMEKKGSLGKGRRENKEEKQNVTCWKISTMRDMSGLTPYHLPFNHIFHFHLI